MMTNNEIINKSKDDEMELLRIKSVRATERVAVTKKKVDLLKKMDRDNKRQYSMLEENKRHINKQIEDAYHDLSILKEKDSSDYLAINNAKIVYASFVDDSRVIETQIDLLEKKMDETNEAIDVASEEHYQAECDEEDTINDVIQSRKKHRQEKQ